MHNGEQVGVDSTSPFLNEFGYVHADPSMGEGHALYHGDSVYERKALTDTEYAAYLVDTALRSHAIVSVKDVAYMRSGMQKPVQHVLEQRITAGRVLPLTIGKTSDLYVAAPETLDTTVRLRRQVQLLSPFDNTVIQRQRLRTQQRVHAAQHQVARQVRGQEHELQPAHEERQAHHYVAAMLPRLVERTQQRHVGVARIRVRQAPGTAADECGRQHQQRNDHEGHQPGASGLIGCNQGSRYFLMWLHGAWSLVETVSGSACPCHPGRNYR